MAQHLCKFPHTPKRVQHAFDSAELAVKLKWCHRLFSTLMFLINSSRQNEVKSIRLRELTVNPSFTETLCSASHVAVKGVMLFLM